MEEQDFLALSETQRKAVQEDMKAKGLYFGPIDGKSGNGVRTALKAAKKAEADKAESDRDNKLKEGDQELRRLELQNASKTVDANAAETTRKTKAREDYDATASSGLGLTTEIGAKSVAPMAGYGLGRLIGTGLNADANTSQSSKNNVLMGVAEDRKAGLTTRAGARQGAKLSGAMPSENALLRVGGRMLPHMITAGGMIAKGGAILGQGGEDEPFYPDMANRALGLGFLGTGVGVLEQGANYAVNPGVAPDAKSIAVIESEGLRRGGKAQAAPRPSLPGSGGDMMAQARRYNIKGRSKMSVTELREAVGEAVKTTPAPRGGAASKALKGMAGPMGAAALAYGMTPDRANAADGGAGGVNQTEALTNAGAAGSVTYGMNKALGSLGPMVGKAIGGAASMLGPMSAGDMTDYTAEEAAQAREAIASIPGRIGSALTPGNATPAEYQGSVYPEAVPAAPEADFDSQLAELQALLAEAGQQPVQAAPQSFRAAQEMPQAPTYAMPQNRLLGR